MASPNPPVPQTQNLTMGSGKDAIGMQLNARVFNIFPVAEYELSSLAYLNTTTSVFLGFLGISVGACLTCLTVESADPFRRAAYLIGSIAAGGLALLCLVMFIIGLRRSRREIEEIKKRPPIPTP